MRYGTTLSPTPDDISQTPVGKYLEWNNGTVHVIVAVPRSLPGLRPTRLEHDVTSPEDGISCASRISAI